jgi:uncharacterized protein YjeT (DUF2065 family)
MTKETLVALLGFILILLPYVGIPDDWKKLSTALIGAFLMLLGYLLLRDRFSLQTDLGNGERGADTFVETTTPLFKE